MPKEKEEFDLTMRRLLGWRISYIQNVGIRPIDDELIGRSTKEGRSEFDITEQELSEILQKIDNIRGFVLKSGKPGTDHPNYEELLDDKFRLPEDFPHFFWKTDGPFHVNADRSPLVNDEDQDGNFLELVFEDPEKETVFTLGFEGNYRIQITPFDIEEDELPLAVRHDFQAHISQIARNEYVILDAAINRYLNFITTISQGQQN